MTEQRGGWHDRLAALRSLDLTGVARQVNAARLKEAILAGETLTALPGSRRCNAVQMKRVLEALVEECGRSGEAAVSYRRLQRCLGVSRNTIHRAVAGLRDAYLVRIDSQHSAAAGQTANKFAPSWPNLIDVAYSQGVQWGLFDEDTTEPPQRPDDVADVSFAGGEEGTAATVAPRGGRPSRLSATGQSQPLGETDGKGASHEWEGPPPTVGGPPSHNPGALPVASCARSTSPRRGEDTGFEEEELLLHSSNEQRSQLEARLLAYGVLPRATIQAAGENGWSDAQILELLAWCESHVVDGVKAYGPALVYRHVERFAPGAPVTIAPRDEYTRAKRDRAIRIANERKAKRDAEEAAEREKNAANHHEPTPFEQKLARHIAEKQKTNAAQEAPVISETAVDGDEAPAAEDHQENGK